VASSAITIIARSVEWTVVLLTLTFPLSCGRPHTSGAEALCIIQVGRVSWLAGLVPVDWSLARRGTPYIMWDKRAPNCDALWRDEMRRLNDGASSNPSR
jgi:hypothetical protein